jgi:hypothetical protein
MRATSVAAAALVAALFAPALSNAQDNAAAVEALFSEGKRLATEGNYPAACPKFLASYNLEHKTGTLLNLADCYEKMGLFASAWARFIEAKSAAQRAGQAERAEFAQEHAAALESKLSKLTIVVSGAKADLHVTRDGSPVDPAALGIALPIDPGDHVVEATAPGKVAWKGTVPVGPEAKSASIEIPPLADAPVASAPQAAPSAPAAEAPPSQGAHGGASTRQILGIGIAGAGAIAVVAGGVFGFVAMSKKSDSNQYCNVNNNANDCYPPGAQLRRDAISAGNMSSIFLGLGGAMIVGGLVVWLTAPSPTPSNSASVSPAVKAGASLSFDGRGVLFSGAF